MDYLYFTKANACERKRLYIGVLSFLLHIFLGSFLKFPSQFILSLAATESSYTESVCTASRAHFNQTSEKAEREGFFFF
jgi:hypothetical protein